MTTISYAYKVSKGNVIKAIGYKVCDYRVLISETMDMTQAIWSAMHMENSRIIVKSDPQVTINVIRCQSLVPGLIRNLMEEIYSLTRHFENIIFCSYNRKANTITNDLT